jgi:GT2 family glycosyltransferase
MQIYDQPLVAVVLVNWNRPKDTLECIRSMRFSTYPNYKIIVVDNGSSDDSLELLSRDGNDLVILAAECNLGFTGGNNMGIRYALAHGADYIFILNNDTVIAEDCIERMVSAAETDKGIGIITPKILFYANRKLVWFGGSKYNSKFITGRLVGYEIIDSGQFDSEQDIPWATGCAMFIRKEIIESVGLFDDHFFAVAEDLDYSLRMREKGHRIYYLPAAVIWHKESISSGGSDAPQYAYYQTRNFLMLRKKWAKNRNHLIAAQGHAFMYFGKRILQFWFGKKWRSGVGVILGMRDGISGITGRKEYKILSGY